MKKLEFESPSISKKKLFRMILFHLFLVAIIQLINLNMTSLFTSVVIVMVVSFFLTFSRRTLEALELEMKIDQRMLIFTSTNMWGMSYKDEIDFDSLNYQITVSDNKRLKKISFLKNRKIITSIPYRVIRKSPTMVDDLLVKLKEIKEPSKEIYSVW
ncbi:MAG: hypothetical protein ABJ004_08360 [Cyclobacteriaceae bacterium]